MYFTDPSKCSYRQNRGFNDSLVNGECHRCNARMIFGACATKNLKNGNVGLFLEQYRILGR